MAATPRLRIESLGDKHIGGRVLLDGVDVSHTVTAVDVRLAVGQLPIAHVTFIDVDVDVTAVDDRDLDEPTDAIPTPE